MWYVRNSFRYAGSQEDWLRSKGVTDDVISHVLSQPEDMARLYGNALAKNPTMDLNTLQTSVQAPRQFEFTPWETRIFEGYEEPFQTWAKAQVRTNRVPGTDAKPQYKMPLTSMGRELGLIHDWWRLQNIQIASYNFVNAKKGSDEWHEAMAKGGDNKFYEPDHETRIVHGPKWSNPQWDGWTIQSVESENDLLAEGNKLNHCVGGYCSAVQNGTTKIYSLRDPNNRPYATVEIRQGQDGNPHVLQQSFGHSNSEPKDKYVDMLRDWLSKQENTQDGRREGSETLLDVEPKEIASKVNKMTQSIANKSSGKYGLPLDASSLGGKWELQELYENAKEAFNDDSDWHYAEEAAYALAHYAWESDKQNMRNCINSGTIRLKDKKQQKDWSGVESLNSQAFDAEQELTDAVQDKGSELFSNMYYDGQLPEEVCQVIENEGEQYAYDKWAKTEEGEAELETIQKHICENNPKIAFGLAVREALFDLKRIDNEYHEMDEAVVGRKSWRPDSWADDENLLWWRPANPNLLPKQYMDLYHERSLKARDLQKQKLGYNF